jgi:uncharacterized FAD-dependent dehydrogenase
VKAGAPPEILYVSKPHIGTFRLVTMVEHMRATIESLGGEFRFQTRVDRIVIGKTKTGERRVEALILSDGTTLEADHVVLAVGHSARDTFQMLHDEGVYIEPKPFSIGFRIEHPQSLIDRARFGPNAGNKLLGAADYKIVHHASNGRSVYSFCMCPGGTVVATASEPGRVVTNGMSQYSRNERNANAGIVVAITPDDYPGHPLAGIDFQRHWEEQAYKAGGETYAAPGQRVEDFLAARASTELGTVIPSYKPSVTPTDLSTCLPDYAIAAIREALPAFDRQIKNFALPDAVLTGVETRTSSPISIRRDDAFQSLNTRGLYPAGEGAGYAGGILSAAIDGIKVAEAVATAERQRSAAVSTSPEPVTAIGRSCGADSMARVSRGFDATVASFTCFMTRNDPDQHRKVRLLVDRIPPFEIKAHDADAAFGPQRWRRRIFPCEAQRVPLARRVPRSEKRSEQ